MVIFELRIHLIVNVMGNVIEIELANKHIMCFTDNTDDNKNVVMRESTSSML